jgi:16S rRNA C967 or C1407 C5-methylase (RsmB/RsmF family)
LPIDEGLRGLLSPVYDRRLGNVLEALGGMGPRYYFRLNTRGRNEILGSMRSHQLEVGLHEIIADAAYLPVVEAFPSPDGTVVGADRFAAEAVMQGAHLYAPGVRSCKGLRTGTKATVQDRDGAIVGSGIARQGETAILRFHRGIAVEVLESRFRLPALRETSWYHAGLIHLQSLPAMVACHVLDPRAGEVVVDLNCSPAGKMSYLCQLTNNAATVIGFDRNSRKIEKAIEHLERLHCENYQLIAHDSRYAHLDYSFKVDKVLVDPPCTGLGVMPKLSIDSTMEDVRNLASYQKQFLRSAASMVKRGGTVVYSVCTITREECEDMVDFAEQQLGLKEVAAEPMVRSFDFGSNAKSQRFDPELDGAGFFIAKFVKE